ncbi:unnamed protein product [Brugia timori]|uniref:Transposase n=1 Tax=Brugia timori TaxID=42155 RepID=A0A0R3R5A8_9BILA|nr:unnamed protein product [Brugia timori]
MHDVMKSIRSIALPAVIIVINYRKMIQKVAKYNTGNTILAHWEMLNGYINDKIFNVQSKKKIGDIQERARSVVRLSVI